MANQVSNISLRAWHFPLCLALSEICADGVMVWVHLDDQQIRKRLSATIVTYINKYGLLTKREVKMTGYWPSSFFAHLWAETELRSINLQKKNSANIQPSWLKKLGQ